MNVTETVTPKSRAAWRRWLEKHHAKKAEVWVVYYKRRTGKATVTYEEAVLEALCFGWIDGLIRRIDDERHMQRFTPRRPGSQWSAVNLRRFARLVEQGLVEEAGRAAGPKTGTRVAAAFWVRADAVPEEVAKLLKKSPLAFKNLMALAPSQRKHFVHFIDSAKRPETRERRASRAIDLLERNVTLEMEFRSKLPSARKTKTAKR